MVSSPGRARRVNSLDHLLCSGAGLNGFAGPDLPPVTATSTARMLGSEHRHPAGFDRFGLLCQIGWFCVPGWDTEGC